ncbi:MAG: hypothetical protein UT97_C0012G0006 [Parcubacteria group bacterium GW2011_GWC2_40_31]|nr:MAG: hypothetical protein UT71_C0026G0006 [Parcubacteria group bacterium GW2011_GWF2_40_10]KKR47136.1 MAG: hypothetical protein UT83_C0013G0014 [Parcubacteria group bacterium GW2011_GWA2_40_143]KKR59718.1 MAG: hypothetical protein UT97_C0012G0006 [Parcubacteria group bacterium GW2011_GWC2_40_31]KKR75782.1 MAG: hypothetical protein UU20_C0043G0003 [Parcubacteria group bacterium GW2011_GWE2_40_8]KKR80351.1 MAG: hypothetical protein UU28_C0042G0009 [Parcubacteria group bacterium GW2011_GWD2_40_
MMFPFAAGAVGDVYELVDTVNAILSSIVPIIIAIAVIIFLIGVLKYVRAGEDEEERKKAKGLMIFGVIALFVMVSVWGLVNIIRGTLTLDTTMPDTIENLLPTI